MISKLGWNDCWKYCNGCFFVVSLIKKKKLKIEKTEKFRCTYTPKLADVDLSFFFVFRLVSLKSNRSNRNNK